MPTLRKVAALRGRAHLVEHRTRAYGDDSPHLKERERQVLDVEVLAPEV